MTQMLWKAGPSAVDEAVQRYLAGDDVMLDRHLLPFDIEATIAHVDGLAAIGHLADAEAVRLTDALHELADLFARGAFVLDERFEDGHTAIESFLTDRLGEVGKKVHLGRSRNDQVLVAQRMFVRAELAGIRRDVAAAAEAALELARGERDTPMPGYTHLQRAVPSTVGLWMAGFVESLADDLALLDATVAWLNACPLGTAAGFGVNLRLDRQRVAAVLGFDRLQVNPMHAQNSRGKHELQALSVCWQILQDVRRLAWDVSLYSSAEFGFLRCGDAVTTGSSIMPNKRNPDLAELMRAAAAPVAACMAELQQLLSLPSGYQRDLQLTKGPVIRGLLHTRRTVELVPVLLRSLTLDPKAMRDAIDADMHATDRAVELAAAGVPFRDAYRQAATELGGDALRRSPEESIAARVSPGACADLQLDELATRLALPT